MSRKIRELLRLSIASATLTAFTAVSGPLLAPEFALVTTAQAANGIRATDDLCFWDDLGWDEMQPGEQSAWAKLGWTAEMWEDDTSDGPESDYKDWDELTTVEQGALMDLGYTAESWENFDSDAC